MSIQDQIFEIEDLETQLRDVPEWGVKIELRQFDLENRVRFEKARQAAGDDDAALARVFAELLVRATYDPDTGEPVFTDPAAVAKLQRKNGTVVQTIAFEIMLINGMFEGSVEEGKGGSSTTNSGGGDSRSLPDSA